MKKTVVHFGLSTSQMTKDLRHEDSVGAQILHIRRIQTIVTEKRSRAGPRDTNGFSEGHALQ